MCILTMVREFYFTFRVTMYQKVKCSENFNLFTAELDPADSFWYKNIYSHCIESEYVYIGDCPQHCPAAGNVEKNI